MTQSELSELYRIVGGLQGTVEGMRQQVAGLMTQWGHQESVASAGRQKLYDKVEAMRGEVAVLTERVNGISEKYSGLSTTVQTVNDDHREKIGSRKTVAAVWFAIVGLSGTFGAILIKILETLWPVKPH